MATATEVAFIIEQHSGIPASALNTVMRRLGEAGLLPRGVRGRPLQAITALDCAHLLIGVMLIADGFGGASARVDRAVEEAGLLRTGFSFAIAAGDTAEELTKAVQFVTPGTFAKELAFLFQQLASTSASRIVAVVSAIGISTGPRGKCGWIEMSTTLPGELLREGEGYEATINGASRVVFADKGGVLEGGLIRETRVDIATLVEIAAVCCGSELCHG